MSIRPLSSFHSSYLFRLPSRSTSIRSLSSTTHLNSSSLSFKPGPAPPRLPKEEQERFEELQRLSTGAFSAPRTRPQINQSSHSVESGTESETEEAQSASGAYVDTAAQGLNTAIVAEGSGEELHPDLRRGARPEFEGERNPKTGEVGGPKNEPLRWGEKGDWSYNGRVTDF